MKLLEIENDFINLLTKLVWWVDVKFNKGTVWVSLMIVVGVPYVATILLGVDLINYYTETSFNFVSYFILLFVILPILLSIQFLCCYGAVIILFGGLLWNNWTLFKNTKKSPNPNRYASWIWVCRGMWVLESVVSFVVFRELGTALLSLFETIFFVLVYQTSLYTLCVNPITPQEKEKRKQEIKLKGFVPQVS